MSPRAEPATDLSSSRPLHVVVVSGHGVVGGAEQWLLSVLGATGRLRVEAVLLQDGPLRAALADTGVPVDVLPVGTSPLSVAAPALRLAAVLRRRRPDVVLANGVKAHTVAGPAALLAGVPEVWVKHDHSFDRAAPVLARLADAVIGTAGPVAAAAGPDAVVVEPPRPEADPVDRAGARAELAGLGVVLPVEAPVLAVVGRVVAYKGIEDAVAALARPGGTAWHLVVLGGDDPSEPGERGRLRALASRLGVADRVVLAGEVPDAGRRLAAFDAVAVLTRPIGDRSPGREGFGLTALEAMLAGVPVVAVAGSPPAARAVPADEEPAGLVVPPADPDALASALGRLGDADLRRSLGAAGQRRSAGHPRPAEVADRVVSLLAAAARRPGAGLRGGPPVTVVVTVLGEGAAVDALLASLVPQLGAEDEVLIVDGGSQDDTPDRVRAWGARDPRVRLHVEPGAGIAQGRNTAVRLAVTPWVALTDAGCSPVPGWLAALRAAAGERDAADLLTGVYRVSTRTAFEAALAVTAYPDPAEAAHRSLLVRLYGSLLGRVYDPTLPTGRSAAVRRSAWLAVGGMREDLQTGEDVTLGRALVAAGHRAVLVSEAEVAWDQRPTVRQTARMYYRYGLGSGQSRDPLLLTRDLVRVAAYAVGPAVALRAGRTGRTGVALGGAAYLSLPLVRAWRGERRVVTAGLVPVSAMLKDVAKASGALAGLLGREA